MPMEDAHNYNKQKSLFKGRYKQHLASMFNVQIHFANLLRKIHWILKMLPFPNYYVYSYNAFSNIHQWWKQTGLHDLN
jgi:hypothetical protein